MGLGTAISGGIVMFVLLSVLLMIPGLADKATIIQEASTEISQINESISRTDIDLTSLSASSGSSLVSFNIENEGMEKLWNFAKFNVILTFDGETSGRLVETLSYEGNCSGNPAVGNWCVDSISTDLVDPGILNEGETMTILATVSENLITDGILIVLFSTENGVITTSASQIT